MTDILVMTNMYKVMMVNILTEKELKMYSINITSIDLARMYLDHISSK